MSASENEIVVDSEPDGTVLVLFAKGAVDETSKIYGAIFARMVAKHALEFEAKKLQEIPPENIQGLEEASKYILANMGRYPRGYCSLIYGIGKAENTLEGALAAGIKRAAYTAMKSLMASSGMLNTLIGSTEDLFEALKKFVDLEKSMKTASPLKLTKKENSQVNMIVPKCPYKEVCRTLVSERISRIFGGSECMMLIGLNAAAEIIMKKSFDYRLEKFDTPECIGKIYKV